MPELNYESLTAEQIDNRSKQLSLFVRKTLDDLYAITPTLCKAEAIHTMSLIIGGMCAEQNIPVDEMIASIETNTRWARGQLRKSKAQN